MSALEGPATSALLTHWTIQPVALVVAVVLAAGYLYGLRRAPQPPKAGRVAVFALGLVLLVWTSCGPPQVYAASLYWVWTSQVLILWLLVPILVLAGEPVQLARAVAGPDGRVERALRSPFARVIGNPLVGPALVPLLSIVLFFGPLPEWTIRSTSFGWLVQLVLLIVGALMVLPLVGLDEDSSSLAVGLSLAIGSFELVLDALPGVVLRLHTTLVTGWFDHRTVHSWTPSAIHDQHIAGAVLWCMAEVIDLPFLVLVYRRWLRADARDAARVDAVLEAERAARHALDRDPGERDAAGPGETTAPPATDRDAPWWLSDPAMQRRLRGRGD